MTTVQQELFVKAKRELEVADLVLERGFAEHAASSAYYARFYIAQAYLLGRNLTFSKHSGTIGAFGREFCQTGIVPREFHQHLLEAQKVRHVADYGTSVEVTEAEARLQLLRAHVFLQVAESSL